MSVNTVFICGEIVLKNHLWEVLDELHSRNDLCEILAVDGRCFRLSHAWGTEHNVSVQQVAVFGGHTPDLVLAFSDEGLEVEAILKEATDRGIEIRHC